MMGDCAKSTKSIAGNAVQMEKQRGVEASNASLLLSKLTSQELKLPLPENDHSVVVWPPKKSSSSNSLSVSDDFSSSRCSHNSIIKPGGLKATSFETEASTCNNKFRISSKALSEIYGYSEDQTSMEAPPKKPRDPQRRKPSCEKEAEKMPSAAEIDEFFTAAEKHEQKRFANKYNYDIVKDAPLEGRYQWVRLNETLK